MKYIFLGFVISYNPIYIYYLMSHGALGGMSFRIILGSAFILLLIYASLIILFSRGKIHIARSPFFVSMNFLFISFILSIFIGIINNNDFNFLIMDTYPLLEMFVIYYTIKFSPIIRDKIEFDQIYKWFGLYLFIMSVSDIVGYVKLTFIDNVSFGVLRAYVGGITVNRLMDFIVPIFLPAMLASYEYSRKTIWVIVLTMLGIVLTLLTFYRTVYVAVFFGVLYYLMQRREKMGKFVKRGLLFVVVAVVVLFVVGKAVQWKYENSLASLFTHRIVSVFSPDEESDMSASGRIINNKEMLNQLFRTLVVGYGMGGAYENDNGEITQIQVSSNYFLQTLLILGVPGGLLFCWLYSRAFLLSIRLARHDREESARFFFGCCASVLISLSIMLIIFPYTNYFPLLYLLGWIFGILDTHVIDQQNIGAIENKLA